MLIPLAHAAIKIAGIAFLILFHVRSSLVKWFFRKLSIFHGVQHPLPFYFRSSVVSCFSSHRHCRSVFGAVMVTTETTSLVSKLNRATPKIFNPHHGIGNEFFDQRFFFKMMHQIEGVDQRFFPGQFQYEAGDTGNPSSIWR